MTFYKKKPNLTHVNIRDFMVCTSNSHQTSLVATRRMDDGRLNKIRTSIERRLNLRFQIFFQRMDV